MPTTARRARVVEGSCWHCKSRRVKCDLAKPACGRCQRDERECSYGGMPFKWVGGMALRGRHAPPSASRPDDLGSAKLQTVGPDEDDRHSTSAASTASDRSSKSPVVERRRSDLSTTAVLPAALASPVDRASLVPYFTNVVLPRYCMGDFVLSLDHNILLQNEALHEAMLAMARAHFDMQSKYGSATTRNRTRQSAIVTFRKQLASSACEDAAAKDLFSTNVLFCLLDGMIEPTEETSASTLHLKGGFAILDRWEKIVPEMIAEGGIRSHLLSVFATLDLVHAILSGRRPHFDPSIYRKLANTEAWWGRLDPNNAIIWAAENLSRVAALASIVHGSIKAYGLEVMRKRLSHFEIMLSAPLRAHFARREDARERDSAEMDEWTAFCTIWDISARIFYERAIRLKPVDDPAVQQYTKKAALMLSQDLFSGMLQHCIVLPLVIIGAHCLLRADQEMISRALSPTVSYLAFGCLPIMEQFLKTTWQRRNLEATWWETFADIAEKTFLF
ncbi:hypothetical protein CB0940_06487 [Cercospora beticola]|uniref:Zn(2)-C6 fungal-type domain-containing protein n=2 Tax=Cercospora beticola TaxID=122368 RepID=A0A2G5HZ70_CERBT|nr:hypothetical protein CB0940_06487 [Cercospora beticola]PIA97839.1 hypothetical protein CB0940_06487 [Cercospora beticola]CAK1360435.1 unnamed protein product [Cercospora beticola]